VSNITVTETNIRVFRLASYKMPDIEPTAAQLAARKATQIKADALVRTIMAMQLSLKGDVSSNSRAIATDMALLFHELEEVWVAFISKADSHSEKSKGIEFLRDVQHLMRVHLVAYNLY
jgi:hypothetical protein